MPCVARCVFFAGIGTVCFNATDYTGMEHVPTLSAKHSLSCVTRGKQNKLANAIQRLACKTSVKCSFIQSISYLGEKNARHIKRPCTFTFNNAVVGCFKDDLLEKFTEV